MIAFALCQLPWIFALSVTVLGTWDLLKLLRQDRAKIDLNHLPSISILKPLKGLDSHLEENLISFFQLSYPAPYEILFSVESRKDPAYPLIQKLTHLYPGVATRIFVGEDLESPEHLGPNPKMNNLAESYRQAAHDYVLISDSNVRVSKSYLLELTSHLDAKTGLVTSIVSGTHTETPAAFLESIILNTLYARFVALSHQFHKPCVVGKCMLFKKSTAKRFGGIEVLSRFLAEDYMAGEAMTKLGLKIKVSTLPIPQVIGKYSFNDFLKRHIRWGQLRKKHAPLLFALEPLTQSFFCFAIGALGAWAFNGNSIPYILAGILFWFILDGIQFWKLSRFTRSQFTFFPFFWMFRELLSFPLWITILLRNHVDWRGSRLKLESGGLLVNDGL